MDYLLCTSHYSDHLISKNIINHHDNSVSRYSYPTFINEETEAQRG